MSRYVLTPLAKEGIREIVAYLRARNPQAAKKVRGELRSAMQLLASFPELGHFRTGFAIGGGASLGGT